MQLLELLTWRTEVETIYLLLIDLQCMSLFFQKKQSNLTRTVENIEINEEDNEIRYFVLLCKADIAISHSKHNLLTSLSCSHSSLQLPACLPSLHPHSWPLSLPPILPLHLHVKYLRGNPSLGIRRGPLCFISVSRILLSLLVRELGRHVCVFFFSAPLPLCTIAFWVS